MIVQWPIRPRLALSLAAVALALLLAVVLAQQAAPPLSAVTIAELNNADPANSLTLFFVRADRPLDWSSPARLTKTAINNYLDSQAPAYSHPIGHSFAHIRCGEGAAARNVWAGVTGGGTKGDLRRLIFGGEGLGIMTGSFTGRMMTEDEVLHERQFHQTSGRAQRIRFRLSPAACARVLAYHDEFVREKIYVTFGLAKRPRWREGVGCTTFVVSLAELAGMRIPTTAWSKSVRIPPTLVGAPARTIGITDLLYTSVSKSWAKPGAASVGLTFLDVSQAEAWIRTTRAAGDAAAATQAFGADATFDDEGIVVDARSMSAPAEPIFYR